MQAESYFQLLNPLMFLLFAAGFFSVNALRPSQATLTFALSYTVGAAAFIIDFFNVSGMRLIGVVETTSLYAVTAILVSAGMMLRYQKWAPWSLLAALGFMHILIYAFLRESVKDYWLASISANAGCGVIFSIAAISIRKLIRRPLDKAIFWLYVFSCAQCFVRPVIAAAMAGGELTPETYDEPLLLLMLHFIVGAFAVIMGMALLIAFSQEVYEDLQHQSVTDRLSGIFNRRGFEEAAEAALAPRHSDVGFAALIIADIDNFKSVNDAHGHAFGDMAIAEFGALFNEYADEDRIAARLGGDEFVMLLPGEMIDTAIEIAEAIRRDFSETIIEGGAGAPPKLSASFGVALRQPNESLSKLLARADEALYLAKSSSRNQVCSETDVSVDRLHAATEKLSRRRLRDVGPLANTA
ncbi:MAG: GGDEF domain-containing protein [Parvularculaceae bacterium]